MADEFDPLKQTNNTSDEPIYVNMSAKIQRSASSSNNDDLLGHEHESIFNTGSNSVNTSIEPKSNPDIYQKLNHMNAAPKIPFRATNPFDEDIKKSSLSNQIIHKPLQEAIKPTVLEHKTEQKLQSQNYEAGIVTSGYYNQYYEEPSYKKKGFGATLERLVQRFPVLSMFYTPKPAASADEAYETEYEEEYVEEEVENGEAPQLVEADQFARELTSDELALNERYSNKQRTQIISLPITSQTQPIDVCLHHESYTIYSCDVGRSVVEIFDMYGKLQHTINDSATTKFQPTAIVVACDGTIILGSHFNHRLHMYSPVDLQENQTSEQDQTFTNEYNFQQYKLGSPGHAVNQFHFPADIAIDYTDGYLYVCDRGNYRIKVLRPEGICERVIELLSHDPQENNIAPIQIAHQQIGEHIACLTGKGEALCFVPKYAEGPTYVECFNIVDNDGLGLHGASGIAIDSEDRIFISDTGHHRIVICTPEGTYITHFGMEGNGLGELKRPCGLDITIDGTIVVADSGNKRLQLFGSVREQTAEEDPSSMKTSDDKKSSLNSTVPAIL
ncbi:unnamed protein product [Rotaria magnacalcarata]|uniref:Uncharacterized protein n=2 Tax=Rotaria magnacalcarata TaxID=392030 RepID=A0A817AAH4_9BILA|nr:unnamed protein product [Rotaria magnacalcarata]CAF1464630.1 unnamed protein product [Rotaria magnacalcarata]CAF2251932.1 unnamed protein product [Rotaria magnacalcarata]CAF3832663.1 unnamed protein product [Rotaria magnacalcarata]CAF4008707.1 unnamed protein product [Rotaria magnacalcarata]